VGAFQLLPCWPVLVGMPFATGSSPFCRMASSYTSRVSTLWSRVIAPRILSILRPMRPLSLLYFGRVMWGASPFVPGAVFFLCAA